MTLGKNFRLPRTVLPRTYSAELSIDLQQDRFQGTMEIVIEVSAPTPRIHLHAVGLTVDKAEIVGRPGARLLDGLPGCRGGALHRRGRGERDHHPGARAAS